jgi:hypothetical protein
VGKHLFEANPWLLSLLGQAALKSFLDFQQKAVAGTADFETSLQDTDSLYVYLGHSVLF